MVSGVPILFDGPPCASQVDRTTSENFLPDAVGIPDLLRYFDTVYLPSSKLCVYGPSGAMTFIDSDEGVRQGDALSAYFFCALMDLVCKDVKARFPSAEVWCYMDDLTVAVSGAEADMAARFVIDTMRQHGFIPNAEKSKCTSSNPRYRNAVMPTVPPTEQFDMLGSSITDEFGDFNTRLAEKLESFFLLLRRCNIHSQLKWTMLRLRAFPKLQYYANATPPEFSAGVVELFDRRVTDCIADIAGCPVDSAVAHHACGAGLPDYKTFAPALYETSRTAALAGSKSAEKVALVQTETESSSTAHLASEIEAQYFFYNRDHPGSEMSDAQFRVALAVRFRKLPPHLKTPTFKCNCGEVVNGDVDIIDHCFRCDRSGPVTHTSRHNRVRDAIASVCRSYGIAVTTEPDSYVPFYPGTTHHRPDIAVHITPRTLVTDVTIVSPTSIPGEAARKAADEKIAHHKPAVEQLDHLFVPFA